MSFQKQHGKETGFDITDATHLEKIKILNTILSAFESEIYLQQ